MNEGQIVLKRVVDELKAQDEKINVLGTSDDSDIPSRLLEAPCLSRILIHIVPTQLESLWFYLGVRESTYDLRTQAKTQYQQTGEKGEFVANGIVHSHRESLILCTDKPKYEGDVKLGDGRLVHYGIQILEIDFVEIRRVVVSKALECKLTCNVSDQKNKYQDVGVLSFALKVLNRAQDVYKAAVSS